MKGAAEAPRVIREALRCTASNMCSEDLRDLSGAPDIIDAGDLNIEDYLTGISVPVEKWLERSARVVALGGDHSVTYPVIRAFAKYYGDLNILHLDAHPDLYDSLDGQRFSHACPFARIMEEKLAKRLVQIGIRANTPHQAEQARRFGVETITAAEWNLSRMPVFNGPVYISLDLDVLDPAFAPGVSHHEPGGLSSREVLQIIQSVNAPMVGADIVELNPARDVQGITASAAAKFLKEILSKILNSARCF